MVVLRNTFPEPPFRQACFLRVMWGVGQMLQREEQLAAGSYPKAARARTYLTALSDAVHPVSRHWQDQTSWEVWANNTNTDSTHKKKSFRFETPGKQNAKTNTHTEDDKPTRAQRVGI